MELSSTLSSTGLLGPPWLMVSVSSFSGARGPSDEDEAVDLAVVVEISSIFIIQFFSKLHDSQSFEKVSWTGEVYLNNPRTEISK